MDKKRKVNITNGDDEKAEKGHSDIVLADVPDAGTSDHLDYGLTEGDASAVENTGASEACEEAGAVSTDDLSVDKAPKSVEEEVAFLKDAAQRIAAEFDNYRKRIACEFERVRDAAKEDLITRLLVILDNLEFAVKAAEKSQNSKAILEGVRIVLKQLREILEGEGLKKVNVTGKFDPRYHECVECEQTSDHESETIVSVIQDGYEFRGKVIRAAKVKVAVELTEAKGEEEDADENKPMM